MKGLVANQQKIPGFTFKDYVLSAVIGGLIVILPLGILFLAFQFVLGIAASILQPLTNLLGFSSDDRGIVY